MNIRLPVTLKRLGSPSLVLLAAIALTPCAAHATPYVVKLTQQGSNVVAVGSGAINLNGLTFGGGGWSWALAMMPNHSFLGTGPVYGEGYSGLSGPASFGIGGNTDATTATGDAVAINGYSFGSPWLFVPQGYVTETTLTSGATWDNATFASLGVTPGTYTWTWGTGTEDDQSFTLMAVTSVPEPAALGMFGLGALLIGGFVTLRRREQRQS